MEALAFLKKTNAFLEKIPKNLDRYFAGVMTGGEKLAQSQVDAICRRAAWTVNVQIEKVRQGVLKSLYGMYQGYLEQLGPISTFVNMFSSPLSALGAVASAVKQTISVFIKPYAVLIQFFTELLTEIAKLAGNLASIASYRPTPPSPHINFNEFKLKVKSVSLGDLTSDPSALPAPEAMFPEPDPVFSKATFQNSFEEARNATIKEAEKYNPDEPSKNTINYNKEAENLLKDFKGDLKVLSPEELKKSLKEVDGTSFNNISFKNP